MQLMAPTELPDDLIESFKALYKKHTGIKLTQDQAHEEALSLLRFFITAITAEDVDSLEN